MSENQSDLEMLEQNPGQLVLKYQPLIETIVNLFIRAGNFRAEGREEIIQHVNLTLLLKIDSIKKQYNGSSQLITYFSAVIRNICLQKVRDGDREILREAVPEYDVNIPYVDNKFNKMMLEQEYDLLEKLFRSYYKQRYKLELCMKLYFRIPFSFSDFSNYSPEMDPEDYQRIAKTLEGPGVSDRLMFETLTPLMNRTESKDNTWDALRRWMDLKINEMVRIMNGNPLRANYNRETFQILVEKYYIEYDSRKTVRPAGAGKVAGMVNMLLIVNKNLLPPGNMTSRLLNAGTLCGLNLLIF